MPRSTSLVWCALATASCAGVSSKPLRDQGRDRLVGGGEAAIAGVLAEEVVLGGAWIVDPSCARFAVPAVVRDAEQRRQLARCLSTLGLRPGTRASSFPDITTVITASGVELEAGFIAVGGTARLHYLGYTGRLSEQDTVPTVTQTELEAHRRPGSAAIDTAAIDRDLAARRLPLAFSWLRLCIDASGAVTSIVPRLTSSVVAQRIFIEAAGHWTFDPVMLDGQATAVCSMVVVAHPGQRPEQPLPFPVPPTHADRTIVTMELAGPLERGNRFAEAGKGIREYMLHERIREIQAPVVACFDETGAVDDVVVLRTSGIPQYDRTVLREVRAWKFAPLLVDGQAIRACVTERMSTSVWLDSPVMP